MTAAEAVLAGRPVITSAVVPAMNEMKNACYQAVTNDVDSYVKGINEIASDRTLYESLRASCQTESKQFIDRKKGLTAVLDNVIQFCFTK
jgi:glycogen(starch) synthase